tara:strand:- start:9511 stop:10155 length:645 start_codon:yes stop_codon:yes gene_type:complete
MGLFSAKVEGGVPDRPMARIPMGETTAKTEGFTGAGFSAAENLKKRQAGGKGIADAFKAGIAPAGKRLQDATIKRQMQDFDSKAVLAGKKAKFGSSRSGMYGSTTMADEMGRRNRENARGRAGITAAGMTAGRDLTGSLTDEYTTMRQRAEQGKLARSPAYVAGFPAMPAGPIEPKPYVHKTTKKVVKSGGYEETPGGSGYSGPGDIGEGEYAG